MEQLGVKRTAASVLTLFLRGEEHRYCLAANIPQHDKPYIIRDYREYGN